MGATFARAVMILATITVASWLAVDTFYKAVTPLPAVVVEDDRYLASAPETPAEHPAKSSADYGIILERNLFGSAEKEKEERAEVEIDIDALEHTQLDLVLLGTVAGDNGYDYAVIEERGKSGQTLFREGDVVSGALLVKIMRTKVVLRVDDKEEVLSMEDERRKSPSSTASAAGERPSVVSDLEQVITLQRSKVDAAVQDMGRLMTDARIRPFFSGGKVDGIMISNIVPGSIFQQLGLRNGDVIRGIDGRPLQSPNDLMEVYKSLESGTELAVDIKRRGRDQLLQYQFID